MDARLERKLRLLGVIVAASVIGAIGFVLARGYTSPSGIEVGISYGLVLSVALGHFGPVIIGEIGDVKRAIAFNGDVMNTAARLEELSRSVDGGFLVSRAAMQRFSSALPFAVRDLGRLPIRGRADGIDVVGIDGPSMA
jgi:class 3 adenylate cyclase